MGISFFPWKNYGSKHTFGLNSKEDKLLPGNSGPQCITFTLSWWCLTQNGVRDPSHTWEQRSGWPLWGNHCRGDARRNSGNSCSSLMPFLLLWLIWWFRTLPSSTVYGAYCLWCCRSTSSFAPSSGVESRESVTLLDKALSQGKLLFRALMVRQENLQKEELFLGSSLLFSTAEQE